jgi:hypothetical protein
MIVCEESFKGVNPNNSKYANYEIDFYAWIPPGEGIDHRLSLRKNLGTGRFEIYRNYINGGAEIVFSGSLHEGLKVGDRETMKIFGFDPKDEACHHRAFQDP